MCTVAYAADDVARLLADASIVRNRLKIAAVITNAQRLQQIRASHGSFATWLDAHHPQPHVAWLKLFKKTFVFVGGEIVGEFLMSTGYLEGAHEPDCPIYPVVLTHEPAWGASEC